MNKPCEDCRLFFLELHRRCTIHLNGECDCPICQGICDCKVAIREAMPRFPPHMTGSRYDAVYSDPNAGRKFGERKK